MVKTRVKTLRPTYSVNMCDTPLIIMPYIILCESMGEFVKPC